MKRTTEQIQMEIRSEYVELKVSDGTTMQAWTARPVDRGSLPGLLVFQEAFGVNAHIRDVTRRFAREGFIAIAPELFHRTGTGFEGSYDAFPTVLPHLNALKDEQTEADERAAFGWLTAQGVTEGRIGAVGYCMGGRASFLAGLTLPIGCATSYYGGGIAPRGSNPGLLTRAKDLRCPVLLFWGGKDKSLSQDMVRTVRDTLSEAGK
ncbi:MAG: dienelactone hydrolase family protein, partial [Acidobacteria bacterium]|nr:dienelactone hydrolase family protein [Acidobacteriota bacterium]